MCEENKNQPLETEIPEEQPLEVEYSEEEILEQYLQDGTEEEVTAEMLKAELEEKESTLKRLKKTVTALAYTAGVLGLAFVVSLGALLGNIWQQNAAKPFAGLQLGKAYHSNITLADYSALSYTDTFVAPTDADVDAKVESALAGTDYEHTAEVSDALKLGDNTNLSFDGYIDDKLYDSACAKEYDLELGSGKFIPGFEEGLVGHMVGEKVVLNLTFPDDYSSEELQGKDVRFEVIINSAERTTYDALTDAIVKEITKEEYATVAAYRQGLFAELEAAAKDDAISDAKNELWTYIAENTTLKKYPQNVYDHFYERLDKQFSSYYSSYGVSDLSGFMTANQLDLTEYIEGQIVYEYAIYTIAADQGITLEDADFEKMMSQYSCDSKEALAEKIGVEMWELESSLIYEKVTDFLYENATAK